MPPYDPTIFQGTAAYYVRGRPQYARTLAATLVVAAGLDGTGQLLDVGCGPGSLTIDLADYFTHAIGLDPDAAMLAAGARRAAAAGIENITWVQARGEDLPLPGMVRFRLATFGQSFHWMDRERVAIAVYDLLEPGGIIALIGHAHAGRPQPAGPGHPPIPHDAIRALIAQYLGPDRRAGQGFSSWPSAPLEELFARTRFGTIRTLYAPGRPDIVRTVDQVLANYFSMSYAAPHLFGARLADFEVAVRAELVRCSPAGLFWDWPGDTEIVLARKPG